MARTQGMPITVPPRAVPPPQLPWMSVAPLGASWQSAPTVAGAQLTWNNVPTPGGEEITTLWVGDLPQGTTDDELLTAFGVLGQVLVAKVQWKASSMGTYSGFVRFATRAEAEVALTTVYEGGVFLWRDALRCALGQRKLQG